MPLWRKPLALFTLALLFICGLGVQAVVAANSYQVNSGQQLVIDEWSVCRVVTNSAGTPIFVPTKTAAEWAAFYNNTPANVSAPVCASCTLDGTTVPHGDSATFYASTRPCYSSCGAVSQVRSCYNGTLDGSATYSKAACPSESCASCTTAAVNWTTGAFTCSTSATAGTHNTTRNVTDSTAPSVGSAAFTCANGNWGQDSGSCGGASCSLPWGGSINHGQSTTAYLNATESCGGTCTSQARTCNNGTLSGSYANQACSVSPCASCGLPWGGSINHGQSVTAYQTASVACGNSCNGQTRSCNNGSLSGSYTNQNCSVGGCASCSLDGATVASGSSRTFYRTSRTCGASCASIAQSRTCTNGTLSGSSTYSKASCPAESCASCSLPWGGTISHNQSVTAYQAATVPCGNTCTSQNRTCSNGTLSGSYANSSCSVDSCTPACTWKKNLMPYCTRVCSGPAKIDGGDCPGAAQCAACSGCTSFPATSVCTQGADCSGAPYPDCLKNQFTCSSDGFGDDTTCWDRYKCVCN